MFRVLSFRVHGELLVKFTGSSSSAAGRVYENRDAKQKVEDNTYGNAKTTTDYAGKSLATSKWIVFLLRLL